jgi:WD40 repeat protein
LLIVCDQFEEIFRYFQQGASYEATNFVNLLLASSKPYPISPKQLSHSIYVVMTMRSDFLGDCAQFAGLSAAINQGLYLTPRLDAQELREAIEEPAFVFEGKVDPDLIIQLLEDAENNPDQLPLLQHVLMRLWNFVTDKSKALNLQDYKNAGGLANALSIHADEAYNSLTESQKIIAQVLFCLLTGNDLGKRDTRRPIQMLKIMELTDKSCDEVVAVIDVFRQPGRCFLMPPIDVGLTPDSIIDISHESLIRQWQRLKDWAKKEAEAAAVYKRLADGAIRWHQGKAALLQSPDLEFALAWQDDFKPSAHWAERYTAPTGDMIKAVPPAWTFDLVTDYIKKSQAAKQQQIEQEQQEQQRKLKQARLITTVSVTSLLIVSALAVWVWRERNHATTIEKQRTTELFQAHLTHASLLAKGEDYAGAKKILEQTYPLDKDIAARFQHARNLLASFTEIKGGQAEQVYKGAGYPLFTVAVSPDGKLLAAAGEHGTLVIFDVQSGELLQRLEGHSIEDINSIVFTPTGEQLISAGNDKKIIVWQRKENSFSLKKTWLAPDLVTAVAISPDGNTLASGGGDDNNITLWELASGKAKTTLKKYTQRIGGLSFSANGDYLASASFDGTAIIWQVATGKALRILTGHNGSVYNMAFSADGKTLATGSDDKTIRLWDVKTGKSIRVLTGHQNSVFATHFLANGAYILSGGFDRTIRLWDSQSGVTLRLWQGHEAGIASLATYANQLFSASNDGTVRRWSLALPYQQAIALPGEPAANAIAPNLDYVAVGFAGGALRLYDLATERTIWQQLNAHKDEIQRLAFNMQGDLLASGSFDNFAKVWHVASSSQSSRLDRGFSLQQQQTLTGHTDAVQAVAFSPNSQTLATASFDGTIGLFILNSEEQPVFIDKAHDGIVASVNFDNTGTQVLSSGFNDYATKLWNLQSKPPSLYKEFPKASDKLMWSSLSPDNQLISTVGREQTVNIYNTQNNQLKYHLLGHENAVYKSIFAPDSLLLATVSSDATVKLWNLDQGNELFTLRLPANPPPPVPMWDFDFRCEKTCRLAVPLTADKLLLYQFAYEGKLEFDNDKAEQKRTLLALWQDYLAMGNTVHQQNALQPGLQAHREADVIGNPLMLAYPDDIKIQETAIRSFYQNARLKKSLNQIPEALAAYQKAIEMSENLLKQTPNNQKLQTDSISIFLEYAEFLNTSKQLIKATGIYQRLFSLPLEDVDLLVSRAEFANQLGNKAALVKDLQQAFEKVDNQNVDQLNSVGQSLANLTNRYQEAYQLLKQALALKPEDPNILDSIGWVLYKMGKNQEALDYLQKSHAKKDQLSPEAIAEGSAHLGEVLWKTGKQNQAMELFKNALHDYPESEIVKKTVKQFAPGLLKR